MQKKANQDNGKFVHSFITVHGYQFSITNKRRRRRPSMLSVRQNVRAMNTLAGAAAQERVDPNGAQQCRQANDGLSI